MTADQLLDALHASIATAYPVRRALSARPGRVSVVIEATGGEFETAPCDPVPFTIAADVHIIGAGLDEQNTIDLPHHLAPVADLVRAAGWVCESWRTTSTGEAPLPEIVIEATASGTS